MKPTVGVTMGDPAGVGPEVVAKALSLKEIYDVCRPVVIGDARVIERATKIAGVTACVKPVHGLREAAMER